MKTQKTTRQLTQEVTQFKLTLSDCWDLFNNMFNTALVEALAEISDELDCDNYDLDNATIVIEPFDGAKDKEITLTLIT